MTEYESLLKSWCDKLLELQITEIKDKNFYGGILCPACSLIHGRIGDSVYPLTLMYDITKDSRYLTGAKLAVEWSENNILRKDGSYFNDKTHSWKGISVFSATSLGDALLYHGDCLDSDTKSKWHSIFLRLAEFIYEYFDRPDVHPNINYFATVCPVMALAYKFTGEEKYREKAYQRYNWIKEYFTEEGLLFGEGHGGQTPKNCKYVDLGYNVEESLPALAVLGHLMNDEDILRFTAEKYAAHIEFMLPDGGWDNSWGTRSNKWTYWGSRTSDGAAAGLCYLTKYGDIFKEAIERNFRMLKECSHDGFLYGGPQYRDFGEDPCIHHSFCHAKAVAAMIDSGFKYKKPVPLPRDAEYGIKKFGSIHVNLISKGVFRATVTDNDAVDYFRIAPTGGTLSALWTSNTGTLLFAAAPDYHSALTEPRNMQLSRYADEIENPSLRIARGDYLSQNDKDARVEITQSEENISAAVHGNLSDIRFNKDCGFRTEYVFTDKVLRITAECEQDAEIIIPIVSPRSDVIKYEKDKIMIQKPRAAVELRCESGEFILPQDISYRDISLIGGFMTLPIKAYLSGGVPFTFTISLD